MSISKNLSLASPRYGGHSPMKRCIAAIMSVAIISSSLLFPTGTTLPAAQAEWGYNACPSDTTTTLVSSNITSTSTSFVIQINQKLKDYMELDNNVNQPFYNSPGWKIGLGRNQDGYMVTWGNTYEPTSVSSDGLTYSFTINAAPPQDYEYSRTSNPSRKAVTALTVWKNGHNSYDPGFSRPQICSFATIANVITPVPDTTPPVMSTSNPFTINGGDPNVNNTTGQVNLSAITATDNSGSIASCAVSNDQVSWQNQPCGTPIQNWTLQSGDTNNLYTVYARACDAAGLCSTTSDSITFVPNFVGYPDTVQGSLTLPSQPNIIYPTWPNNYTFQIQDGVSNAPSNNQVTLDTISANSPNGISYCSASNDGINWTNVPCNTNNIPWTLENTNKKVRTVYARACDAADRCAYIGDNIGQYNGSSTGIAPVITHLSVVPTSTSPNTAPGFTSSAGIQLKFYLNDRDPSVCAVDSGSGFGSNSSVCSSTGYKTLTLPNLTSQSTTSNWYKSFTLRALDDTSAESRATARIVYENTQPTASYEGYTGGMSNAPFSGPVTMRCEDSFGCQNISYYVGQYGLRTSCQDVNTNPSLWETCDPDESDSCTRTITVENRESLCVKVTDNVGKTAYSERSVLEVDNTPPTFGQVNLYTEGASSTNSALIADEGTYFSNSPRVKAFFEVMDQSPTWSEYEIGGGDACKVSLNGEPALAECSFRSGDFLSSFTLLQDIPDGSHLLEFTLSDRFNQSSVLSFPLVIDTKAPVYNLGTNATEIQVTTEDATRLLHLDLPAAFEDIDGSGIGEIRVRLTRNNSSEAVFTLADIMNPTGFMSIDGNELVIQADSTSGEDTFPSRVTFRSLEAQNSEGMQHRYTVAVSAKDRAGNALVERPEAKLSKDNLTFDTLAPTIGAITRPGMNITRFGSGTSENDPYRVGADGYVGLRIPLTEQTNNYKNTATLPLNIRQVQARVGGQTLLPVGEVYASNPFASLLDSVIEAVLSGQDLSASISAGCTALDGNRSCNAITNFSIPDNFIGNVRFYVQDGAGNASNQAEFWVKQDSRPPLLLPGFALSANIAPAEHYKATLYRFTAAGIDPNGDDKELTAFISYMQEGATTPTLRQATMTLVNGTTYSFDAALENIAYGAQDIAIYFEDNYGNRHEGSGENLGETLPYAVYHDNVAPIVEGLSYSWVDNAVNVRFDSVTEDSYPLTLKAQTSSDGTTWTDRAEQRTFQNASEASNALFSIADVLENEQIRIVFGDTVKDYQNGIVIAGSNPRTDYIVRDILLTVTEQGEALVVSYTPESGVDTAVFKNYSVSYAGPNGRTGSFTPVTTFTASGAVLGSVDLPLKGTYEFDVTLSYNDGRANLSGTKTYEQTTDIIKPKASLTLPLITDFVTYDTNLNRYYVRTDNPALSFSYSISPQFVGATTIFDDSLPLTLTIEGAEDAVTASISPTGTGNFTGALSVDLLQERTYNLVGTISDGAGLSVSFPFEVVKDASIPDFDVELVNTADNIPLSVTTRDDESILMTKESSVFIDVITQNEDEQVTYAYETTSGILADEGAVPNQNAGTQSKRLRLTGLTEGVATEVSVTITDRAGSSRTSTVKVQRDATAPILISGEVAFNLEEYGENPVGITADFQDVSRIDYIVTASGATLERRPYNGTIRLPEGTTSSLSIRFLDELDNETAPYVISSPVYVDSIDPSASISIEPDTEKTNLPRVRILANNIVESGPYIDWSIRNGAAETASGRLMQSEYATLPYLVEVPLLLNSTNTLNVILRDSVGNSMSSESFGIIHDDEEPVVAFDEPVVTDTAVSWSYTVMDEGDSGIANVQASIRNISNGMRVESGSLTEAGGKYSFSSGNLAITPGQNYRIEVTTADDLGNEGTQSSAPVLIEGFTPGENPLLDPVPLPEVLTGETISVVVSNGSTINYVATDMPLGENLYLQDVLALGRNTVTNSQLEKFPIGYYTITITDSENHTHTIENYLVTPYYFDLEGDINGDGFNAGISDHKLLKLALELETVYVDVANAENIIRAIQEAINQNIAIRIQEFLVH